MVRIKRAGTPKKSAHFLHFLPIFVQKALIFCNFLHFLTLFDTFLHFFALFLLPILPIHPIPTPQSPFLAHKLTSPSDLGHFSPQKTPHFKKLSQNL